MDLLREKARARGLQRLYEGGKSQQQQSQTFTDNRSVVGEGANSASSGSTITNYVVDNGTVAAARDATGRAFDFASDSNGTANSTVSKALATTTNFASDALALGSDALTRNGQAQARAFDFGSDVVGGALSSNDKATTKALNFGSDALAVAGDALARNGAVQTAAFNFGGDALAETLSSIRDTIGKAFTFGSDAAGQVGDANARSLTFSGNVLDGALGFGQRALDLVANGAKASLDNLQATQQLTADAYSDAKGRGALTDKILIATVVGALVVAALAVKKG